MQLVYLAPVPWNSFSQRPHKFVEWFHRQTGKPALWVEPYPTRFPHWGDFRRSHSSVLANLDTRPPKWLTLLRPNYLPIEPLPISGWINGVLWRHHSQIIDKFVEGNRSLLAVGKPSVFALKLLKHLNHCPSLYDAMDDFPAFYSGISRFALARREREIIQRVDVILASSSKLKSRLSNIHKDVRLVKNGLDLSAVQAVTSTAVHSEQKIFGYVGTIGSWFDWKWVCALAEARPNDEIRLIGPVFDKPNCRLPRNINILPACDHASALKAMTQFHVGLIPFKKNALTASVDPIKYYEYRAFGLPVISTDFGEMRLRNHELGVFISQYTNDVPVIADAAIQYDKNTENSNEFAVQNTWESRFDAAKLLL